MKMSDREFVFFPPHAIYQFCVTSMVYLIVVEFFPDSF